MPIFEFSCDKCGTIFEEITTSEENMACPNCGATQTRKIMSTSARGSRSTSGTEGYASASSGRGCGGCSGGNCASCGH